MTAFIEWTARLSRLSGIVAALMILVSVIITCQMIFVRTVLNQSTIWQTEFITYLMIAATLLGLPYVQLLRGHVNVDLLPLSLPHEARRYLFLGIMGIATVLVAGLFFYGVEMWWEATSRGWRSDTVWGVRLTFPYLAVPVGLGLFMLQLLADFLAVATGRENPFGLAKDDSFTTASREGH